MSFMGMKLLSHLIKLLHLMNLPSQQFYLCGTLFNVHDTLIKHALRPALAALRRLMDTVQWPDYWWKWWRVNSSHLVYVVLSIVCGGRCNRTRICAYHVRMSVSVPLPLPAVRLPPCVTCRCSPAGIKDLQRCTVVPIMETRELSVLLEKDI